MFIIIKIKLATTGIKVSLTPHWLIMKNFVIFLNFGKFYRIPSLRLLFNTLGKTTDVSKVLENLH